MTDFIRREDAKTFIHDRAIEMALNNVGFKADASDILEHISQRSKDWIDEVPAADVVSRDCYDRILAENDTMREQLAQIGKKPGDSMDDVRPIVKAEWLSRMNGTGICSNCHRLGHIDPLATHCRFCGAEMIKDKRDCKND